MVCIYCGKPTQVTNSRLHKRVNEVWRRRQCKHCKGVFTTYETAALETSVVVQYTDNDLRPFSRDTVFLAIYDSCRHRADAAESAAKLTQTIISELLARSTNGLVTRSAIIETCTIVLGRFDDTARTVYAAYHQT